MIDDVTAERNAIGYYGTNASGRRYVVRPRPRQPPGDDTELQKMELLGPQGRVLRRRQPGGTDNDDPQTPEIPRGFFAGGIAIGGGRHDVAWRAIA